MKTLRCRSFVLLCALLVAAILLHGAGEQRVTLLVTGGTVVTVDGARHVFSPGAVAVNGRDIVAAPEGIALVQRHHPDVHVYTPVVDAGLNAQKYILPGLGDFGDRLYGTF